MSALEELDIQCPYCGEIISVLIDCSIQQQDYIEDCQVCCKPINFFVRLDKQGLPQVHVTAENE